MTTPILVLGSQILAVNPADAGDHWATADQIIPKAVAPGAELVGAELPPGFALGAYQWQAGQLVAVPAPTVPPVVPEVISMAQAQLALLDAGLLALVEPAIDAMPEPQRSRARIWWLKSSEVHRDADLVLLLARALGLTDAQVDVLFIAGAKYVA